MRVLLLLVDLYVFQCAFLDDLLFVFLGLLECCLVLAVPLQVVHAVLSALVLNTKFPHFSLQVFELMPFLLNWRVSAAFGHVFDGSFYCDFVVVASIEGKVNGEIVFSDGFNSYFQSFLLKVWFEFVLHCFFFESVDVLLDVIALGLGQHLNRVLSLSLLLWFAQGLRMQSMYYYCLFLMLSKVFMLFFLFFMLRSDFQMKECLLVMHVLPRRNSFLYSAFHMIMATNATIISMM